jgi:hypothetical protein
LIYGFEECNNVVLEANDINNATYILDNNWREISKLTKAQILKSKLCKKRIIHNKSWHSVVKKYVINN